MGNSKGRPYDEWRNHYGYEDTPKARNDYAEYQKQLDILTPEKRKPGRPPTGKALTPAEKQRAYRERLKQRETKLEGTAYAYKQLSAEKHEIAMKLIQAEARILVLEQKLADALERLKLRDLN